MASMHRTQISLDRDQYELLTREARRRGMSLSALLRELVNARYQKRPRRARRAKDPLAAIIGIGSGTGEAVGRNHNVFLYGRKRV
jgi:hypothetical protein